MLAPLSLSAQTAEHPRPTDVFNLRILDCLKVTQAAVTDMNSDGKINCIDYAVTFKGVWDSKYLPENCQSHMEENWSYKQYNPAFNIYGETNLWLENRKKNVLMFTTSR